MIEQDLSINRNELPKLAPQLTGNAVSRFSNAIPHTTIEAGTLTSTYTEVCKLSGKWTLGGLDFLFQGATGSTVSYKVIIDQEIIWECDDLTVNTNLNEKILGLFTGYDQSYAEQTFLIENEFSIEAKNPENNTTMKIRLIARPIL